MASEKIVVTILRILPPKANYATVDTIEGGSTPEEEVVVYDFDDTTIEYLDLLCFLWDYDGGGLTWVLPWSATSATSDVCKWDLAIRRMEDDLEALSASHSYQFNPVTDTAPSTLTELSYPNITFTNGADMDNWANGELAIVRIRRDTGVGSNLSGDAELWMPIGKET